MFLRDVNIYLQIHTALLLKTSASILRRLENLKRMLKGPEENNENIEGRLSVLR